MVRERIVILLATLLGLGVMLAPGQSVLDRLKARIENANKAMENAGKNKQQPQNPAGQRQPQQPPQQQIPPSQPSGPAAAGDGETGTAALTASLAAKAGFLDVVGIKLGMTVSEAMVALKAANPNMTLNPRTFRLEGFGQDLMPNLWAESPNEGKGSERYFMSFTVPPSKEVLWGITRLVDFDPNQPPTRENVLAGLRQKYGQETGKMAAQGDLYWVFDPQGNRTAASVARVVADYCPPNPDSSYQGEYINGRSFRLKTAMAEADCSEYVVMRIGVPEISSGYYPDGRPLPKGVALSVNVSIENGALHRSGLEATRAVALGARRATEKKDADDASKRGAPKF